MTNDEEIIRKLIKKTFDDIFKSKTFKCSIYLIKYINDKEEEYFNKFFTMFKDMKPIEQMQVMCNVRANLMEQGKLKEKSEEKRKIYEETDKTLIRELGIPYDIFEQLDFDEQQKIIEYHRQQKRKKASGEKYMLSDGTIVRAGDTPEESRAKLEDQLDDVIYSKPVAFIKKLSRKIKNR